MARSAARNASRSTCRPSDNSSHSFPCSPVLAALAFMVLTSLLGCRGGSSEETTVVALVNAKPITLEEVDYRWAELPASTQAWYRREGGKRKFLDELITRELLLQEARRRGLEQSLSVRERLARHKEQLLLEELMNTIAGDGHIELSEQELERYYAAHAVSLLPNETIHLAHIVVPTIEQGQEIKQQLDLGADFGRLAQKVSTDSTTKNRGGEVGVYRKGVLEADLEPALYLLRPGMVSEPVKTSSGVHLLKVLSRQVTAKDENTATRERLRRELHAESSRKRVEQFISRLRNTAHVRMANASRFVGEDVHTPAHPNP
jgi:peptidyl-prolyl cis-trans isomerase C